MAKLSSRSYVPISDTADNVTIKDVVGSKSDTSAGDSIYSHVHILEEHAHSASMVYPTLANGVTVTEGAAWTLGAFAQVVPASTIGSAFDIHHVGVENISANGVFELVLYYGAGDTECGRVRFTKNAVQDSVLNIPIQTPIIPLDSKIQAKVASAAGGVKTVDISLFYHIY